jgi:hypothetical protein
MEDRMGHFRFLFFYLLAVSVRAIHILTNAGSTGDDQGLGRCRGDGAYRPLPRARMITLIPIFFYPLFIEIPAVIFLGTGFSQLQAVGWPNRGQTWVESPGGLMWEDLYQDGAQFLFVRSKDITVSILRRAHHNGWDERQKSRKGGIQ